MSMPLSGASSLLERFAAIPTKREKIIQETHSAESKLDCINSSCDSAYRATLAPNKDSTNPK